VAASFVRRHGYRVLTRNYKTTGGEIDLVCRHGDILAFVEVKTRAEVDFGQPAEAIDVRKEEAFAVPPAAISNSLTARRSATASTWWKSGSERAIFPPARWCRISLRRIGHDRAVKFDDCPVRRKTTRFFMPTAKR